jgi:hypothetical protein
VNGKTWAWLAAALVVGILAGCGQPDTGRERLIDYLNRLSRTVDIDIEIDAETSSRPPSIVAAGLKPLPLPESQIGVLDFLSLSGCDLQQNVGRRNSHLGRHASPSQQLLLDLEFLEQAPSCIAQLKDSAPDLAEQLSTFVEQRRQALPTAIYNGLLADSEWRELWRLPAALGDYPAQSNNDIGTTLTQLANRVERWLGGDWQADNLALESLLSELRAGDGGALLQAAALQAGVLSAASDAVDQQRSAGSLCPFGRDTEKSQRLRTVAAKYFAGGVQPWLADLRRREVLILPPVQRIESALAAALPEDYLLWRTARDEALSSLTAAPRRHAETISESLADCGGIRRQKPAQ